MKRLLLCLLVAGCAAQPPLEAKLELSEVLGKDSGSGYARADKPRKFSFPQDHGPHPEFRTEWWYFTGNLETAEHGRLGYELTFFRRALRHEPSPSRWASGNAYMAHLALTDARSNRFLFEERFSRDGLELAGATPQRVWLEDWEASPTHLRAHGDKIDLDLDLESLKPPVLQGEEGLSRKGSGPGQASYYYSLTRLRTRGTVNGQAVTGSSWMDREWSSEALPEELQGWDWFALQLQDGRELMLYQLRRKDGTASPQSRATLVAADGTSRATSFTLTVLSQHDGYPAKWRVQTPELDLVVTPLVADQELALSIRYWEGAVTVSDGGRGYLEMVGYK